MRHRHFFVALRCGAGVAQEHLGFCKSLAQEWRGSCWTAAEVKASPSK